jgi:hypothetical protein
MHSTLLKLLAVGTEAGDAIADRLATGSRQLGT